MAEVDPGGYLIAIQEILVIDELPVVANIEHERFRPEEKDLDGERP